MSPERKSIETKKLKGFGAIQEFFSKEAANLQKIGIPINGNNLRVDESQYQGVLSEKILQEHAEYVREKERGFEEKDPNNIADLKLELLTTAILKKYLGSQFFVFRSSKRDDYHNGFDTVLVNKKTGFKIAPDETIRLGEKKIKAKEDNIIKVAKEDRVRKINLQGGAIMEYSLGLNAQNNNFGPAEKPEKNIPLFYLYLPRKLVNSAFDDFSITARSDTEKKILKTFLDQIEIQARNMLFANFKPQLKEKAEKIEENIIENIPRDIWQRNFKS